MQYKSHNETHPHKDSIIISITVGIWAPIQYKDAVLPI